MTAKYPLQLKPYVKEVVWGGRWLADTLGRPGSEGARLGESWEAYASSEVMNGIWQGQTLEDVFDRYGAEFAGFAAAAYLRFPLLAKFIDARENLSIQVHPNDSLARVLENYPFGKTEFWYVLDAVPDAHIYYGLNAAAMLREDLQRALTNQDLLRCVKRVPVTIGDVVFIPAGTIHALTAGIVVYELQQDSDITYRLYDWGRTDREMHFEKGLQSINPKCADMKITHPQLSYSAEDQTHDQIEDANGVMKLAVCEFFKSELWCVPRERNIAACKESFTLLTVVAGSGTLTSFKMPFENIDLKIGSTVCVPAGLEYTLLNNSQNQLGIEENALKIITGQIVAPGK